MKFEGRRGLCPDNIAHGAQITSISDVTIKIWESRGDSAACRWPLATFPQTTPALPPRCFKRAHTFVFAAVFRRGDERRRMRVACHATAKQSLPRRSNYHH